MKVNISFSIGGITRLLILIAFYLAVQSITGRYVETYAGDDASVLLTEVVRLFNINRESSVPTWYASSLLLVCAVFLGVIAYQKYRHKEAYRHHWLGLALIFLYLSLDEAATIHEILTDPLQEALETSGPLFFGWVVAAIPLVILFALAYIRFWWNLPTRIRTLFFLAGAVYVGGALGIEMIGANQWYHDGGTSLLYSTIGTVEEFCEMLGAITLIYALWVYLAGTATVLQITVQGAPAPVPNEAAQETMPTPEDRAILLDRSTEA